MVPEVQPYHFGTKRTPLENGYYDVLNQDNVEIVDINANPLKAFEETGMRMNDGQLKELDVVILATGFDTFTGSLTNMGLKSKDGKDLKELWKDGIFTYLGLTISGFPNCFM
jgi:cation diffusion facilitator CzcD-associated flavoprotein CzcO